MNAEVTVSDNSKKHSEKKRKKNEACQIKKNIHCSIRTILPPPSVLKSVPYFFFIHSEIGLSLVLL